MHTKHRNEQHKIDYRHSSYLLNRYIYYCTVCSRPNSIQLQSDTFYKNTAGRSTAFTTMGH